MYCALSYCCHLLNPEGRSPWARLHMETIFPDETMWDSLFLIMGIPILVRLHIDGIFPWCWCSAWLVVHQIQNRRTLAIFTLIARFMGPTWGPPGADRTDRAPCWPAQPCYLGISLSRSAQLGLTASGTKVVWNPTCILFHFRKPCLYSHNNTEHD